LGPPGHFAIGLAAKGVAPKAPLWVLLLATEVLDLLSFGFQAIGIEDFGVSHTDINQGVVVLSPASIPWSHGLFMSVVWSVVAAAIALLIFREHRTSSVIGLVVFSHWVLDFIVHPPELPLFFNGSPLVGLGLWTSGSGLVISGILEFSLFAGGIAIYLVTRKRKTVLARE
jgi:hypothetical protein